MIFHFKSYLDGRLRKCTVCLLVALFLSSSAEARVSGIDLLTNRPVEVTAGEKGTVAVFMSARCPCSNSHARIVKDLAKEFKDFSFLVIHSNADEPLELSRPYFRSLGLPFPVIEDNRGKLAKKFKALKTPHAYLIGAEGSILYKGGVTNSSNAESADRNFLRDALVDMNAGRAVKNPETRTLGCLISRGEEDDN